LSFGKFKETGSSGKQHDYMTGVTAENRWNKRISKAEFTPYVFDKTKVRIRESWLAISDAAPGGVVNFHTAVSASGTIRTMELVPRNLQNELQTFLPSTSISITVNSMPQGAEIKIADNPAGVTAKIVQELE
jgi:hypothetical protein